jgi:hypothetical protein
MSPLEEANSDVPVSPKLWGAENSPSFDDTLSLIPLTVSVILEPILDALDWILDNPDCIFATTGLAAIVSPMGLESIYIDKRYSSQGVGNLRL